MKLKFGEEELKEMVSNTNILEGFNQSASYEEFINNIYTEGKDNISLFYKEIADSINTKSVILAGEIEGRNGKDGEIDQMITYITIGNKKYMIVYEHIIGGDNKLIEIIE